MNLFGLDVRGLDVDGFVAAARAAFPFLALAWLGLVLYRRRPGWLLAGVLAANAYAWGLTNYPLQRMYALGPSSDRVGNLGLCQVVAAGNPPLQTVQAGQLHFEPLWGVLVAAVSGYDPERVLAVYPFLPLVLMIGFALAVFHGLRPVGGAGDPGDESRWERAVAAGFATLLSSSALEFYGVYRVPWAMTFLLKPNHAVALALFPVVLRAFAGIRSWRGRLAVGFLLHLLAWAFVLHMVYAAAGLVLFAVLSFLAQRREGRRAVTDVAVVIGVNVLIVSPYLYMLFVGYPFLDASPRLTIHPTSPHLLETTTRHLGVFLLGLWGLRVLYRRGDRLGRLWVAQVAAAHLLWAGYLVLSALQLARERDEIYYWTRFLTAAVAGIGAWDLARRAADRLRRVPGPALRAVAVAVLALPWSLPYWWDPARMDAYFPGSVPPVAASLREPTDFLRTRTDPRTVVAGDREYARYVAALGARRVLLANTFHSPKDFPRRHRLETSLVKGPPSAELEAEARHYGVGYLVVTPALLATHEGASWELLESRPDLERVHLWGEPGGEFVAVFRVSRGSAVPVP